MVPALSTSGREITDAVRIASVSGDGRQPEGSFGVWSATTNLEASASADVDFESGTTGYTTGSGNTISSSTEQAKGGTHSCKCVYGGDPTLLSISLTLPD